MSDNVLTPQSESPLTAAPRCLLAVDAGLRNVGVAAFSIPDGRLLQIGAELTETKLLKTSKRNRTKRVRNNTSVLADRTRRCMQILDFLMAFSFPLRPSAIVAEMPSGGSKSGTAMGAMGMAMGLITAFAHRFRHVPFIPLSAGYCQKALLGPDKLPPKQVKALTQDAVRKRYPAFKMLEDNLRSNDRVEAAADAVQCGHALMYGPEQLIWLTLCRGELSAEEVQALRLTDIGVF